jgi:T3SS negative regulator,GrlR
MLSDGLYKVAFLTPIGAGAGVIYIAGGRMWGGDAGMYYVGTYTQSGDQLTASVTTERHTVGANSVFGIDRVHINMRGTVAHNIATMQGSAVEAPNVPFQVYLTKISD